MDDRRRHERFSDVFRAELRDRATGLAAGLVADISSGGLLARAEAPRAPGEELDLVVVLPVQDRVAREVPIQVVVRWCEPDLAPGAYVLGLAFRGATPPDGPTAVSLIRLLKSAG